MIVSIIFACKPFLFWVIELCELVSASGKWMPGGSLIANELQVVWLNFSILLNWSASRNSKQDHGMHWHASAPTVHAIRTRHASRLRKIVDRLSAEQRAPWDEDESCERTLLRWFSLSTNRFRQTMTNYHLQTSSWWVACCSFCGKQYLSRKQRRCDTGFLLEPCDTQLTLLYKHGKWRKLNPSTCSHALPHRCLGGSAELDSFVPLHSQDLLSKWLEQFFRHSGSAFGCKEVGWRSSSSGLFVCQNIHAENIWNRWSVNP